MTGYEQFLVVVLASFLAIFLLLGIVVLILIIRVVVTVRQLAKRAELMAERAEHISEFLKNAAGPFTLARGLSFVADVLSRIKSKSKTKRKG